MRGYRHRPALSIPRRRHVALCPAHVRGRGIVHRTSSVGKPSTRTSTTSLSTGCGIRIAWSEAVSAGYLPETGVVLHSGCSQARRRFTQAFHIVIHRSCCECRGPSLAWGAAHTGRGPPCWTSGCDGGGDRTTGSRGDGIPPLPLFARNASTRGEPPPKRHDSPDDVNERQGGHAAYVDRRHLR